MENLGTKFVDEIKKTDLFPEVFGYFFTNMLSSNLLEMKVSWFNLIMDHYLARYHTKVWNNSPKPRNGKEAKKLEEFVDKETQTEFDRLKEIFISEMPSFKQEATWSSLFLKVDKDG